MSESYLTTESTKPHRAAAIDDTPRTGGRFTPLRSEVVVRNGATDANAGETLSPLVPVRRQDT